MKQRNLMKKTGAFLLAAVMAMTVIPALSIHVFAEESDTEIETTKLATVEELKSFNTDDTDGVKNPARVYFGNNNQQWWVAGSQNENVTLFAASPLATGVEFEPDWENNKKYDSSWNCKYPSDEPSEVYPNHYGASDIRNTTLKNLETNKNYFSESEQEVMCDAEVTTNDTRNGGNYVTTDKLYLAYGENGNNHITVGTNSQENLNNGLRVDMDYWGSRGDYFWLRAPRYNDRNAVLIALPRIPIGAGVGSGSVANSNALVPAFELNLSNVSFASAAPAASSGGNLEVQDVFGKDVDDNGKVTLHGAFTLRYAADKYDKDLGSAEVSFDKSEVTLTGAKAGTYLVVQNNNGAWAKQVTDQTTSVSASDMGLDSFANCKVWLETTNAAARMTYATLATEEQPIYDLEIPSEVAFKSQHIGYEDVSAQTVEIANAGNVEVSNIKAVLAGEKKDVFTLETSGMKTTLAPGEKTTVTVKSNTKLNAGTYAAQLEIKGDENINKKVPVQFTVEDHTFKWVVDKEATTTEKGSKHEECSVCGYKKASVEIPVVTSSNTGKPDGDKTGSGKGSVETGDSAPTGLLASMLAISALGMVSVVIGKKKRR